jgi:hypothetical protein
MSTADTRRDEVVRADALEGAKPTGTFILPWRMDAIQEHLYKDLQECGCSVCPDDDQEPP